MCLTVYFYNFIWEILEKTYPQTWSSDNHNFYSQQYDAPHILDLQSLS